LIALAPCVALHECGNEAHDEEDDEVVDDIPIEVLGDVCTLAGRDTRVEHDLCLDTSEYHHTQHPFSVANTAATKQDVVNADRFCHLCGFRVGALRVVL